MVQTNRLAAVIRKDQAHPHIRPYVHAYVETLVDGTEVIRQYLELLFGRKAIDLVKAKLQGQIDGLKQSIKKNEDLANIRKVMKEADSCKRT